MATESSQLLSGQPKNFYFMQKTPSQSSEIDVNSPPGLIPTEIIFICDLSSLFHHLFCSEKRIIIGHPGDKEPSSAWFRLFSGSSYQPISELAVVNRKPRKVPVKIEPKVFFANERTFLAWLHMSVTLASISVAIVA